MRVSKMPLIALLFAAAAFALTSSALAQMGGGKGGQMGGGTGSGGMMGGGMMGGRMGSGKMAAKPNPGEIVNEGKMSGYTVRFHNMSMRMGPTTNHLMVYILGADGKAVLGAKTAYEVTAPDGEVQKVMCNPMGNGYGGNVDLSEKGKYTVRLSALVGEKQMAYDFEYVVK